MAHFLLAFLLSISAQAFEVPPLTGPVIDLVGIFPEMTTRQLEKGLRALYFQKGTQIQVLVIPNLDGLTIEEASIKVVDQWKLGNKKTDEGVLLLLAMKEHRVRIEVGQGLEGVLPDIEAKRIIRDFMVPLFKQGDFGSGVLLAVFEITKKVHPDFNLRSYLDGAMLKGVESPSTVKWLSQGKFIEFVLVLLFFLTFGVFNVFGLRGRRLRRRGSFYDGGWPPFGPGGGGGSGGWGSGGGGFSGGGASGDW